MRILILLLLLVVSDPVRLKVDAPQFADNVALFPEFGGFVGGLGLFGGLGLLGGLGLDEQLMATEEESNSLASLLTSRTLA